MGGTCYGTTTFVNGPFTFDTTAPVDFQSNVTIDSGANLSVNGGMTIAGTGVNINPTGSPGNVVMATTGTGTISMDAPYYSGAGILIGTATPSVATSFVQIGTPVTGAAAPSGVVVRANLDTYVMNGTAAATTNTTATCSGSDLALSGGCDCAAGSVMSTVIQPAAAGNALNQVKCTCSQSTTVNAYAVCERVQ